MDEIRYKDFIFEKYISNDDILKRCKLIAKDINQKYKNERLVFIGVLNGCFPFMSSLLKFIECDYSFYFIKVSSYSGVKSGKINFELSIKEKDVLNNNVIIIEDIIDTGKSINYIKEYLNTLDVKNIKIVSLLVKNTSSKLSDWFGFEIDDKFVIGYGMDLDDKFRNLKDIYIRKV